MSCWDMDGALKDNLGMAACFNRGVGKPCAVQLLISTLYIPRNPKP